MRELARKGDVIALDLGEAGLAQARIEGLRVIARDKLDALAGTVTRLDILAGIAPEPAANATGGSGPRSVRGSIGGSRLRRRGCR